MIAGSAGIVTAEYTTLHQAKEIIDRFVALCGSTEGLGAGEK